MGLTHEPGVFFGSPLATARRRFVMPQICVRRPDDAQSLLADAQAKIHVVKAHGKILFVEAAELLEQLFADDQARSGHSRKVLLQDRTIEITVRPARQIPV